MRVKRTLQQRILWRPPFSSRTQGGSRSLRKSKISNKDYSLNKIFHPWFCAFLLECCHNNMFFLKTFLSFLWKSTVVGKFTPSFGYCPTFFLILPKDVCNSESCRKLPTDNKSSNEHSSHAHELSQTLEEVIFFILTCLVQTILYNNDIQKIGNQNLAWISLYRMIH